MSTESVTIKLGPFGDTNKPMSPGDYDHWQRTVLDCARSLRRTLGAQETMLTSSPARGGRFTLTARDFAPARTLTKDEVEPIVQVWCPDIHHRIAILKERPSDG